MLMKSHSTVSASVPRWRQTSADSQVGAFMAIVFGVAFGALSWFLLGRTGLTTVMALLGAVVVGSILSFLSWRNLAILVSVWLFTMSGFRTYAMIYMPVLPDVSLERILAVWVIVIYILRLLMRRDRIHGPFTVDILLLMHTLYILANVTYIGDRVHTHEWAISSLSPFLAYFIGKNVMYRERDIRYLFAFFLIVTLYYSVQSVAEKFDLNFLIWPKAILDPSRGHWPAGRSRGPFLHPPLFGQVLAMVMLVQFYFFYRVRIRIGRALILGSIALSGLALLYTYTRAPWVAAIAGVLTLAVLRPRYRQLVGVFGGVVAVAALIGVLQLANQDAELLQTRVGDTQTVENRLAALSAALRMWQDHPLFGIGYFNWEEFYSLYRRGESIPLYGYVPRRSGAGVVIHDIYWGRLAEEGLVSLALLAAVFSIMWFRFRKLWYSVSERRVLNRDGLAVMAAIVVCYMVGGLAIDYRYFDLVNAIPYLIAGILYGYKIPAKDPLPPPYPLWTPPYFARTEDHSSPTADQV